MTTQPLAQPGRGEASPSIEEAQFRARMARLGSDSLGQPGRRRSSRREHRGSGFRLGWKSWTAINVLVVLAAAGVALTWPPVSACRAQDKSIGFYAGDSLDKCIRRGVVDRFSQMNQRMTMLVRGSGR